MSRGQENQVVSEAQGQNATNAQNAQTSYSDAQQDIGNYQGQLSKFAAANPYGAGGAFQTDQNRVTSNTADAAAQAAGQVLQSQAVRTGQNSGGAIAATEAMQQENTRNLSSDQAQADAQRLQQGAAYGQTTLNASQVPATLEAGLSQASNSAANSELGTQQQAAQQPSFLDMLGQGLISAGTGFATGFGGGLGKSACWIAARLFGGWHDERVIVLRAWIFGYFGNHWYGMLPARFYARYGQKIAEEWMPKSRILTWALRKLFEAALRRAEYKRRTHGLFCMECNYLIRLDAGVR